MYFLIHETATSQPPGVVSVFRFLGGGVGKHHPLPDLYHLIFANCSTFMQELVLFERRFLGTTIFWSTEVICQEQFFIEKSD